MSIALVITDRNAEKLQRLLKAQLPEEVIELWPNIEHPEAVEYAVMWKHPQDIWQQLPNLKVAQSLGAGVDHFIYDEHVPEHVVLSRIVDDSLAHQMAQYVLAVILMRKCRLADFAHQQQQPSWAFQKRLKGNRVCILGIGKIGDVVAKALISNDFEVVGWSRHQKQSRQYTCISGQAALYEALANIDYVVNLLPDTPQTSELINEQFLSACHTESWVINVGRGRTVNEAALLNACQQNIIAGATLDVFKKEPLAKDSQLWNAKNIQITPHIAAITDQGEIIKQVAKNYLAMKSHTTIDNVVNKSLGY